MEHTSPVQLQPPDLQGQPYPTHPNYCYPPVPQLVGPLALSCGYSWIPQASAIIPEDSYIQSQCQSLQQELGRLDTEHEAIWIECLNRSLESYSVMTIRSVEMIFNDRKYLQRRFGWFEKSLECLVKHEAIKYFTDAFRRLRKKYFIIHPLLAAADLAFIEHSPHTFRPTRIDILNAVDTIENLEKALNIDLDFEFFSVRDVALIINVLIPFILSAHNASSRESEEDIVQWTSQTRKSLGLLSQHIERIRNRFPNEMDPESQSTLLLARAVIANVFSTDFNTEFGKDSSGFFRVDTNVSVNRIDLVFGTITFDAFRNILNLRREAANQGVVYEINFVKSMSQVASFCIAKIEKGFHNTIPVIIQRRGRFATAKSWLAYQSDQKYWFEKTLPSALGICSSAIDAVLDAILTCNKAREERGLIFEHCNPDGRFSDSYYALTVHHLAATLLHVPHVLTIVTPFHKIVKMNRPDFPLNALKGFCESFDAFFDHVKREVIQLFDLTARELCAIGVAISKDHHKTPHPNQDDCNDSNSEAKQLDEHPYSLRCQLSGELDRTMAMNKDFATAIQCQCKKTQNALEIGIEYCSTFKSLFSLDTEPSICLDRDSNSISEDSYDDGGDTCKNQKRSRKKKKLRQQQLRREKRILLIPETEQIESGSENEIRCSKTNGPAPRPTDKKPIEESDDLTDSLRSTWGNESTKRLRTIIQTGNHNKEKPFEHQRRELRLWSNIVKNSIEIADFNHAIQQLQIYRENVELLYIVSHPLFEAYKNSLERLKQVLENKMAEITEERQSFIKNNPDRWFKKTNDSKPDDSESRPYHSFKTRVFQSGLKLEKAFVDASLFLETLSKENQ